jgi:lactam utilization protein B
MCVHGDTPNAVKLAKALRKGLTKAGIKVERAGNFI